MAEITFDGLNENSLIMQWNTDNYGNPKSIHINNEVQQVSVTHHIIQLAQIPDEYYRARFVAEGIDGWLIEVRNLRELKNINNYYVDYNHGIVYFHEEMAGRLVRADYYGRGVMFLSDTRIFHKSGDSFATTLDEVLEKSKDALKLIESTGGLNQAIELLDNKAEEGNKVADRLENFITETQFYGYTIVLSREAFVVRAKEDGNLHNGEMEDLTVDVVVYKGAKNLSAPDLDVRLYSTTNCQCEIENQKLTVTHIDVDCIQAQAIIEIDCGDGLIAYRTIEVTKVFDGVSQFNVEMTNAFHSFSATHSGKIEEEQSVTCEFTVTKANEEFRGYVVGIQNVPSGITHNLEKPTENASSVTFTAQPGMSLPDNASISVVFQFSDYVITKTFAFTKSKQGLSAKSLRLTGNQIIHYENPNYEGTPNPTRTSIIAQVTDLSGTPVWSYLESGEWIVIDGQNGTSLNLYHNDRIWGTKHELTIKCELDGFSDEITLIKIANGAMGLSSYSVILSNESTTLRVGLDGKIPTEELTSQYTRVTAFKGADQITPTSITVPQADTYEVSVSGSTINLIDVDASTSTVNIPIEILLDNAVVINKVWSIAKTEKGEIGAAGAVYSINVEGGTRAITYNQLNENPRPTFSGVFTAHIYENGNDITSQIKSWYWTTQGHFTGTSISSSFTPEIKDRFDESILNNSVTVTAIYNHMPISYTVPIVVSKDLGGLDWVTDWDSTKVSIRDTEVLTPKLFAGEYNPNSDTINGVAIGTDVLNDGQVQGITGYQNNKVSFLLATDGSLLIGNPFEDNGTGLSYNHGRFVLNVDEMAIAGGAVPTWDDMEIQLEHHSKDIINAIQDNIDSMNESLNDMTTFVDTILQDELITTLEKVQLDALFQTVTQEVNNIQAQYDSVINNPYLGDEDVQNLEKCYVDYMNAYSNIVDVYNDVFGEPVVEEVEYTIPEEEYLMADDFVFETVDVVDNNEVLDENMEEQPVMLADENVDLNPFMLDTLTTQDGYIIVTKNGQPIQMVTENTLIDFTHAVDILREYSSILQQAISEALLSISENRATQMVEEAKEQVRAEIADVDSALNDLETTMNGSFKSGLIGEQSKAILNERLMQLDIEKKDVDGQYEVLSQNNTLDTLSKEKLSLAKIDLDVAHDVLVAKINQVIIDNLMTDSELQAVNSLIGEYANELQNYSKVAQECNATIALNTANLVVAAITDEDIFNKVTNYGALQGLFLKDEKVYINSEYINTRNFKAVTDDGKETFKIDENGEVSITAKSLAITGSSNLATQDYVNTQIENLTNTNITFTLSNEFQIIPTDESYYPLSEGTYSIKVTGYKGSSEEITDFTIGTVTLNDTGIIPVVSNINKTIVLSVSPDTPLSDSNGYVDIPITYDNRQFNKRWSWAVSKQGNQATTVTITGEQFFKYSNNYTGTPTPSQIKVTANVFNSTETGKWQYDNNGTWVDCGVTDKVLTLLPTQYTLSSLKRVTLRYYVDSVFDTFTVACISDGANGTNGENGTNGKGISSIVNKYLATSLSSGVTTSTSGWTTTTQQINKDKKYLWNYEIITYTDNSKTETIPCIIGSFGTDGQDGEDGQTGVGITNIVEYYLTSNSTNVSDVLLGDWSTSMKVPNKNTKYLWNYSEIEYTNGIKQAQSPRIIGNYAEDGQDGKDGTSGSDAYTVLLTNENHTFVANHLGVTAEQIVTTDVIAYKGTTPVTPTIGALPNVTGLTLAKSGVRITIKANANVSTLADSGSFDIPITVDGKSFTKSFSWTKVKNGQKGEDGQNGAAGTNAKSVDILASNMVFKSTDGGTAFSPDNITLTAQYQNLTHSRWQYSIDGGTTWTNVYDSNKGGWQGGITATSDSLTITIPKTCAFFTDTTTSVVFKTISTDESFYDVITITKLYDVADLEVGSRNILTGTSNSKTMTGNNTTNQCTTAYYLVNKDSSLAAGKKVTLQFKYSVSSGATGSFRFQTNGVYNSSATTQSGYWGAFGDFINVANQPSGTATYTQTLDIESLNRFSGLQVRKDNFNGTLTISEVVLVVGNKVTDWSPAPEDVSQEIDDKAQAKIDSYNQTLNQQAIFNKLTNNGQTQGIYLENGELYVNGEYINSKNFRAEDNNGNQTFLIDSNGNVHINANSFAVSGNSVPTTQDVLNMINEYGQEENLLLTPNFNSGSLTNWSWSVSSYVFVSTTHKHDGNTACKLQYTGTSNAISLSTAHMSIDKIQGGSTYKASVYVYCDGLSGTTGTYYLRISGTPIGSTSSVIVADRTFTSSNLVAGQWAEISFEFTPTQDYTTPRLLITGTGAINVWVTDFALYKQGQGLSQEQIVQFLNGAGQGFYIVDGQALINAEYIQAGTLAADLIKVRVDEGSNLLPINYITLEHAINDDIYIQNQDGVPYGELVLPTFAGGSSVDASNTILGYSKVSLKKGKSYWFSCRCYAQWDSDTKPYDGVGTSTVGKSKYGIQTGNNLDIVLYNNTNSNGMNTGRNLLDHTDGTDAPHVYSGAYVSSGFQVSNSPAYINGYDNQPGHLMLISIDSTVENYYRFMAPNPGNMYGLEPGETYTLSGKACGTMSEITIRHQYHTGISGDYWRNIDGKTIPLKGENYWQYFELTFTIPYGAGGYYLSFQDYNQVYGKNCYLAELKLEKSNKATPWCKSPVDKGESNPTTVEKSKPVYTLGSVHDFNAFVNITDGANEISTYGADGMMYRTWTTLVNRIECRQDFEGYIYICLDASGFMGGDYGWFYFSKFQLTDGTLNDEYYDLDYLAQLKEKRIELADTSYYKNLIGVDGIVMDNGHIKSDFEFSGNGFELNENGFKYDVGIADGHLFTGMSKSYYSYDGGSSGMITGYDDIFGFGCSRPIGGNREGIFIGVHEGFQVPNQTEYGRADIYSYKKYDGITAWDEWTDWELLGARIEPNALVRRNDKCSIATNGLIIQGSNGGGSTDFPTGGNWHGSVIFSEPMYNATGNGQIVNTNVDSNRIYVGNPNSILLLESSYGLTVNEAGTQKQVVTNGYQYGNPQVNIYTGNNIAIWADSDCSTTTESVWIGAGKNAITITSYGQNTANGYVKYNGNPMYHEGNVYQTLENAYSGRDVGSTQALRKIHSYNLYNKSLLNGDGTTSAYGGYWSVLHWGNGASGSAELAIDWTSSGKGFYMRSLRDTENSWWKWKRIGNSDWILDSTSDERYKRAIENVNTKDCYEMVKNIELHTYLLLTEEERYSVEKGELDANELLIQAQNSEGIHHSLQMGVLAQDVLEYSFGNYVVNQEVMRDENGDLISDRYGIDAYNYASAILGGLQEEIKVRDEQYEQIIQENNDLKEEVNDLKDRLDRLEQLILKGE